MGRLEKVNQQLKREVSMILQRELHDPRLQFVSITYVDVSPDLRNARVYFCVLGAEKEAQNALIALNNAKGIIRKYIAKTITMRFTPEFSFYYDDSIAFGAKMDATLKEIDDESVQND